VKNVELYISELLFEHDCVILPSFGGFVARAASANFAKTGNILLPPSKSIVFNKNLSNNDGLLAGYIMTKEKATYQQAATIIEHFVDYCKHQLENHKRFELNGLGILYKSSENTILFEQDLRINHNTHAFGLPAVHAVKLVKKEPVAVAVKPLLQYREVVLPPVKAKKPIRRVIIAASLAVCIITLMFLVTKQNPLNSVTATFSPFKGNAVPATETKITPSATPPLKAEAVKKHVITKPVVSPDTTSIDKTSVIKSTPVIEDWHKQPYQIVVGCFSIKQNAFKLINQLEQQNLQASIAGQNAKNLYVVSVAGYTVEADARKKLIQIKAQYPSAWLFKR
jgi:nucleoid DNA-binding protein